MKKQVYIRLLLIGSMIIPVISTAQPSQQVQNAEIEINVPDTRTLVEHIYTNTRNPCTDLPTGTVLTGNTQPECAGAALDELMLAINNYYLSNAIKESVKFTFKLIKLIPIAKGAGYFDSPGNYIDLIDLAYKGLTAEDFLSFLGDFIKFGFGKLFIDKWIKKLRELIGAANEESLRGEVFGNFVKFFSKTVWDKIKDQLYPKSSSFSFTSKGSCESTVIITNRPGTSAEEGILGVVTIRAFGDCHCTKGCRAGNLLRDWMIDIEMPIVLKDVETYKKGILKKVDVMRLNFVPGPISITIGANCGCPQPENPNQPGNTGSPIALTPDPPATIPIVERICRRRCDTPFLQQVMVEELNTQKAQQQVEYAKESIDARKRLIEITERKIAETEKDNVWLKTPKQKAAGAKKLEKLKKELEELKNSLAEALIELEKRKVGLQLAQQAYDAAVKAYEDCLKKCYQQALQSGDDKNKPQMLPSDNKHKEKVKKELGIGFRAGGGYSSYKLTSSNPAGADRKANGFTASVGVFLRAPLGNRIGLNAGLDFSPVVSATGTSLNSGTNAGGS